jgi:anaerobic selenocysteine-containing dehydrogenase
MSERPVVRRTFCRICPALCGLLIEVDGERVLRARGDAEHPVTRGYSCPKGRALPEFHHHPNRLNEPTLHGRTVSWDDMLADLASTLGSIVDQHGPDAVAVYFGTWSWMDALGRAASDRFMSHLGSHSRYSATTVDAIARVTVAELLTGHGGIFPAVDPDDPGLTILFGTNPVVSHGHAGAMIDPVATLRRLAECGLWVVDPRRTETARLATRHLAPRPGSDPALLAYLVRSLLEDGADEGYLDVHAVGIDELRAAVAPWTAARACAVTQLPMQDLDELVSAVRSSRVAVITGTGCTMAAEANLTEWLAWVLQIVTGSFERPGGAWFNPGALSRLDQSDHRPRAQAVGAGPPSRPELPWRYGEWPCAALADEIEQSNVRALLVIGGNPLRSLPDTARLQRAFERLDVLAVADVIMSDTAQLATHLLPVAGQLERADVTWFQDRFPAVISAQRTDAVVPPGASRRALGDVMTDLGERLGLAADADPMLRYLRKLPALATTDVVVGDPPRAKGWVVDRILPGGRWRVAPPELVEQLGMWSGPNHTDLVAIPRRAVRRMNSALRDVGRGHEDDELWVHPFDADRAGLHDRGWARLRSAVGELVIRCRLTSDIVPGSVSIPHGLATANVSRLTRADRGAVDPLTGMIVQSGIPVTVTAAPDAP